MPGVSGYRSLSTEIPKTKSITSENVPTITILINRAKNRLKNSAYPVDALSLSAGTEFSGSGTNFQLSY